MLRARASESPSRRSLSVLAILAGLMAGTGCVETVAAPRSVPTFRVDETASEVTARHRTGESVPADTATKIRAMSREILDEMVAERPDLASARPMRIRADVVGDANVVTTFVPCLILLVYLGCPATIQELEADVTFEVDGRRYRGHAKASRAAGLYYNLSGYQTVKRLLQRAIADAFSRGPTG